MSTSTDPVMLPDALKIMAELQDLDNHLGKLDKQRLALQKEADTRNAELAILQKRQDDLKKTWDNEKKRRGLLELEVKAKEAQAQKLNGQLGELKSNEAYKAMLTEIQNVRKDSLAFEEQILQLMQNEETIKAKFEEDSKTLETQAAEALQKQETSAAEAKAFSASLESESSRRAGLLKAMGEHFMAVYERFHKANRGKVISRLDQERCSNCKVKVSAHQVNEVRKLKSLCYCQSCGLILVYA